MPQSHRNHKETKQPKPSNRTTNRHFRTTNRRNSQYNSPFPHHRTAVLATKMQETATAFAATAQDFADFNVETASNEHNNRSHLIRFRHLGNRNTGNRHRIRRNRTTFLPFSHRIFTANKPCNHLNNT